LNNFRHILLLGLWVICLLANGLHAQDRVLDSLKTVLATQPRDTHRVTLLNAVADIVFKSEIEQSLAYMNESILLADSLDFMAGLADAKIAYAEAQNQLGGLARSMTSGLEAYGLFNQLHDTAGLARTLMTIGLVQNKLFHFKQAVVSLEKAAECYEAVHDERGWISAYHNLAVVYVSQKDTNAGKVRYLANLRLLQGTKYDRIFAATYNNLGNLLDYRTQGDSAIYYYEIALDYKLKAKVPNKGSIGNTLMNMANVYLDQGKLELTKAKLLEAEQYVIASNEKERLMELHKLKGKLYFKMGRFKESAENFELLAIVQDSMFAPQMTEQASRMEAAFDSENQKKEIELLNQSKALDDVEKTRWRWLTGGITIGLILAVTLLLVVVLRGRERNRMLTLIQQKSGEIRRQQQEIVLQNEALSLQNKRLADLNQEKDGLIGIVAHDIRAPLNRSAALAELISSIGNLSPEQQRYVQMIKKVSDDGGRLIQDLLELNSYEQNASRVEFANVDLLLVLEHAHHGFVADAAQKGIDIALDAQYTIAKTDEKLLARIIDNLLSNAVKFTPKGKKVFLSLSSDADRHWIYIRDEGPGISKEDQKKMFQKFMRLTARPTGGESSTGLGLSIVQALAERIGVALAFESTMGIGSCFKIGIPR
jgi:signal transduction histidine kinase